MDIKLQSPSPPVNMLGDYLSQQETTLTLHCHDSTFQKVTALDTEQKPVFRVEGSTWGTSWSWRRKVFDAADNRHLFDFRHESFDFKNRWIVEDATGRKLCSLVHKNQLTSNHLAIDATVRTVAGEDILVCMRPQDGAALTTTVSVSGIIIATIRKAIDNTKTSRGDQDNSV
ncbi:hypothetical protein F4824DRAFT_510754 [Ustulina deusta]|nr:hypothetical protein F4824DRAFT_510754 [Ustulina deusta]